MKVIEIIKFYSELKECNESVESIFEKFGLGKYLNTYTVYLSGGNKRKLIFAIAMMNRWTFNWWIKKNNMEKYKWIIK